MKQVPQEVLDETLDKMAALMRDRPTITVRELASSLGFAEERSIYYWLKKAGYHGIRDFREDVFRATPADEGTESHTLPVPERAHQLDRLPVKALTLTRQPSAVPSVREAAEPFQTDSSDASRADLRFDPVRTAPSRPPWLPHVGASAYALTVEQQGYAPAVLRGDILIVDPDRKWRDGDMVVVERAGGRSVIARAYGVDPTILVHLIHPHQSLQLAAVEPDSPYRVAPVVQLIRSFG